MKNHINLFFILLYFFSQFSLKLFDKTFKKIISYQLISINEILFNKIRNFLQVFKHEFKRDMQFFYKVFNMSYVTKKCLYLKVGEARGFNFQL